MTSLELAEEFTQLWETLEVDEINTMLAKNVSFELLDFFVTYGQRFVENLAGPDGVSDELSRHLPNLLVIGYLIRLLEERVN